MSSIRQDCPQTGIKDLSLVRRRAIRAWCMYDWANSAFATSGVVAIFPVYFVFLFKEALGDSATILGITFTGSSVWSLAIAVSTATVALSSPVLGVISDRVPIKKALLWVYTGVGSLFTVLAFFSVYTGQPWAWLIGMFTLANVGFAGSLVFYNSFLPHLGPRHLSDEISSRGFAYGYAGGGLLLLLHLGLILATQNTDFADLATRAAIASVGIWWFGWAIWTLRVLPEPPISRPMARLKAPAALAFGFRELGKTFGQIKRFKVVLTYLGSFLLFNDGIQTVLAIAGAFAADTLGIPLAFNMGTIVIIQFIAIPGALAFSRLADKFSTKTALTVSLAGWVVIVLFGVAVAPLAPAAHAQFDVQLSYLPESGIYRVAKAPDASDAELTLRHGGQDWILAENATIAADLAAGLPQAVDAADDFRYSLSILGGQLDGASAVGALHPSSLGRGPIDWWPTKVRSLLWGPLGLDAGYQWLVLGVLVGMVIGGSQALARSLFAQITPEARSGEFFSFFGFMSRVSAVFGPTLYIVATAVFDTRVAVTSILLIIVAGTIALKWVDVAEGVRVATGEDAGGGYGRE